MNLSKLFKIQKQLDDRIVKEKGLEGQDLLDKKILALQVKLGELANELPEVFKFWSNKKNNYEKTLEELVDCWHFVLSIGNDIGFDLENDDKKVILSYGIDNLINDLYMWTSGMKDYNKLETVDHTLDFNYIYKTLYRLGKEIGFSWEQIEQSYLDKNKINHERLESGY